MRIASLAAAAGLTALAFGPPTASAQDRRTIDPDLAKEIRRIVREEVRAALRELRSPDTAEQKRDRAPATDAPREPRVDRFELHRDAQDPSEVRDVIRRLGVEGSGGRAVRIEIPELTDRIDVDHIRKVLEQSLEPKLRDAERQVEVIVKRLEGAAGDADVTVNRAVEKALRSVDLERLEADLKPLLRDAERQVEVIVKRLDGTGADVGGALEKALKALKSVDLEHVDGLDELKLDLLEGAPRIHVLRGGEPREIRVEIRADAGGGRAKAAKELKELRVDGTHRVLVVPEGDGERPVNVWLEKAAEGGGAPQTIRFRKVDTGAEPKKEGDGGCCEQCGCDSRPKGRIMV